MEPILFNPSAFAPTISRLITILEFVPEAVLDWFKKNKMVANPDKFQTITLDKRQSDHTKERITADNQQIKTVICETFTLAIKRQTEF